MPLRPAVRVALAIALACLLLPSSAVANGFALTYVHEGNFGGGGSGPGQFDYPWDAATNQWGETWVADADNNRLQLFGADQQFDMAVGGPGTGDGEFGQVRAVATDRWGNVYAVDGGGFRIQVFTRGGYYTRQFEHPTYTYAANGIAVALDGTIYVSSQSSDESYIARFSRGGTLLGSWEPTGPVMGIAVSQDGDVYAAMDEAHPPGVPSGGNRVIRYSSTGTYLGSWGETGTAVGQFSRPYDVSVDGAGRVFVMDTGNSRVQVFTPTGTALSAFGLPGGATDQLQNPFGLSAGFDRTVKVADTFNNRISSWEASPPAATATTEVAGATRVETAVEASKRAYPGTAPVVVVATAANWPDALGGAALAGVARGPLLLTNGTSVPDALRDEVLRLKPQKIYVLGGTGVISDDVKEALRQLTITGDCERLGGADRYATANLIATEAIERKGLDFDGTVFVATGVDFPDALAASPIAAANAWPIFLTPPNALPAAVQSAMVDNGVTHGYILGGTGAVSAAAASQLEAMLPPLGPGIKRFGRIAGSNRYSTAAALAEQAWVGMGMLMSRPALATGTNFPDALAGGVLQGSDCCPLLLTPTASLDASAAAMLSRHRDEIYELRYLGGTGAVSSATRTAARALLR